MTSSLHTQRKRFQLQKNWKSLPSHLIRFFWHRRSFYPLKKIFFSKFIISFFKYFFYLKFFSYFYFIKKNFFSSNPCVKGWLSIDCSKGAALLHMKPISRSRSSTNGLALGSPCLLFFWKKILSEPRPFLLFLIPHWTLIPFPLLVFPNFRNASVGVESPRAQSHGLISLYRLIFQAVFSRPKFISPVQISPPIARPMITEHLHMDI